MDAHKRTNDFNIETKNSMLPDLSYEIPEHEVCAICCHKVDGEYVKSVASNEPMNCECVEDTIHPVVLIVVLVIVFSLSYPILANAAKTIWRERKEKKHKKSSLSS